MPTLQNVGDSRLYLAADGTFDQVTQDHSLIAEMVRLGELTPEQRGITRTKTLLPEQ